MAEALLDRLRALVGSHQDDGSLLLYLGTALAALLLLRLVTRAGGSSGKGEEKEGSGGRIRRAMSFTSAACAEGTCASTMFGGLIGWSTRM